MTPRFLIIFALAALSIASAPARAATLPADTTAILSGAASLLGELPAPVDRSDATTQAVSKDGRFVAFSSSSDGLSGEDDDSVPNIYVKDMATGAVTLVSRRSGPSGAASHDSCFEPVISDNGNRVAFTCDGSLDPADTNSARDVYMRDLTTDETLLVSRKSGGGAVGDRNSITPSINQDGTRIAFSSFAQNLAGLNDEGVYLADTQAHTTALASDPPGTDDPPNARSESPSISDDGNLVAFQSDATNFAGDDTNNSTDVFVRKMSSGAVVLASRVSGQAGIPGNRSSTQPALSGDGTVVAFTSEASNLAPAIDSRTDDDVYKRSLSANTTTIVDAAGTVKANMDSELPSIDDQGDVVAFQSLATNLDPGVDGVPTFQVYAAANGGAPALVSRATGESGAIASVGTEPSISGDGHQALFSSRGSVTGDVVPRIATLALRDLSAHTTASVSRPAGSEAFSNQAGFSFGGSMSADGRFVAFSSSAPGLGVPADIQSAIIVRDTVTGATVLASRADGPDGAPMDNADEPSISADGHRVAFEERPAQGPSHIWVRDLVSHSTILVDRASGSDGALANAFSDAPSIDGAGDRVAFDSVATNLDPDDPLPGDDVYVRDLANATTTLASRGVDGEKGNQNSDLPSLSADGDHVAFTSLATNLGDGDTDLQLDIHVRDLAEGTTRLASVSPGGEKADRGSDDPSISGDGSRVAFDSSATNLGSGAAGLSEAWVRDFAAGTTELVSRGDGADGPAFELPSFAPLLSANGRVVAFTADTTGAVRGIFDRTFTGYRRDLKAATTKLVSRAPGPDGAPAPSGFSAGITADGACVAFDATGGLLGAVAGASDHQQVYMRTFAADCGRPSSPVAPPARDTKAPVLRSVSLTHRRFQVARGATRIATSHPRLRRGTQLRFTSSEAAKLTIAIQRAAPGRRARKGHTRICKPVRHRARHGRCTAYRPRATLTRAIEAGRGHVALTGRIGKRRMAPGRYRLILTASDAAGNRSKPLRRSFTIVAG